MSKELTYKDVWDNLSKIDCSDKVEKKMNLSYLSWAWAWGVLQDNYPQATYLFYQGENDIPYVQYPDGTAEVRCRVSIDNLTREMTLSVMDNRNNAIQNPNSRQVNDTKMRCLVKCLAMWGLGHFLYAGEDTPSSDKEPEKKDKPITKPKKVEPRSVGGSAMTNVQEETKPVEQEDKGYGSEAWAELFVKSFIDLAKVHKTKKAMTEYYKSNTKDLATLRDSFPKMKEDLDTELKQIVSNLEGE